MHFDCRNVNVRVGFSCRRGSPVQMRSRGDAGLSNSADYLPCLDHLSFPVERHNKNNPDEKRLNLISTNLTRVTHHLQLSTSVKFRKSLLDKGRIEVHHYACHSLAVVKAHTIAMNFIAVLLFAHQHYPSICRSFHRVSFQSTVVHTPVVVAAGTNTACWKTRINDLFQWLRIMLIIKVSIQGPEKCLPTLKFQLQTLG